MWPFTSMGVVSCPVSAEWHSCLAAVSLLQAGAVAQMFKTTLNPNKQYYQCTIWLTAYTPWKQNKNKSYPTLIPIVLSMIVTLDNAIHTMAVKNTFKFECDKENSPSLAITASEANNTCRANGVSDIPEKTTRMNVTTRSLLLDWLIKVSGPFVETPCVFWCIKNIINAEMWAWKNDYN